ncbi:MAG: TetR/AcrR family transcriptional regulator [Reichenbachiella sp.]
MSIKKSKKQIILEEAACLFRDKGYSATTMRDLATKVGMEAASLYNHIKSKEQILQDICFSLANTYTKRMDEVHPSELEPIEKVKNLVATHIQIHAMSSPFAAVMNDEWRHLNDETKKDFVMMREDYDQKFISIIDQGTKKGQLKDLNPEITYLTLLSSIRWLQHWYHANDNFDVIELKNTITDMLLSGIIEKCSSEN